MRLWFVSLVVLFASALLVTGYFLLPDTSTARWSLWMSSDCYTGASLPRRFPVSLESSSDDIREAFKRSGYKSAIQGRVRAGDYPVSYLIAMMIDPVGWLEVYGNYLSGMCPTLFVKPSAPNKETSGVVTIQPQPKTTTVTTTVTKTISESEAVLVDLKEKIAWWLSDLKYPRVEYKHSFLAPPYRVYAEEIRVSPNGDLELYGVQVTVVESGKVYKYNSFLVEKEKK